MSEPKSEPLPTYMWSNGYMSKTPEPGQPMKLAMIDDRIRSMIQQLDEVLEEE